MNRLLSYLRTNVTAWTCLVWVGVCASHALGAEPLLLEDDIEPIVEDSRYRDNSSGDESNDDDSTIDSTIFLTNDAIGCADNVSGNPFAMEEYAPIAGFGGFSPSGNGPSKWDQFRENIRIHHSSTDGRTYGPKRAIKGTSWLNRPYYLGGSIGGFFMTQGVQSNIRNDNDLYGAIHFGWDWDYYWGLEGRVGRSSPEMVNSLQPTVARRNGLLITDLSLMYYPTGDTVVRPYLKAGIGWTDFDIINDAGSRVEVSPFTVPLGMGVKWPVKKWLAARLELTDNVTFGDSAVNTHQNFTLVFGLEYRLGVRPKSYWPWDPSWRQR